MAKTLVEKVDSPDLDVTIFKISGTLGFHENQVLTKFFNECSGRGIKNLVMDLSELGSLGGGCAKIIRDAAAAGLVRICIAGASTTVQGFLQKKGPTSILFVSDVQAAVSEMAPCVGASKDAPEPAQGLSEEAGVGAVMPTMSEAPGPRDSTLVTATATADPVEVSDRMRTEVVEPHAVRQPEDGEPASAVDRKPEPTNAPAESHLGIETDRPVSQDVVDPGYPEQIRTLKRRLVQYRWLFSLNQDFSRIEDKGRLLDAFLLTTIAQVGVESAAFLEACGDEFVAVCWKGFETADPSMLNIKRAEVNVDGWIQEPRILSLEDAPFSDQAKGRIDSWDLPRAAPFVVHERFRGIVLLGRPIRQELDDEAWEFLNMMINQVAIAYENSCRLEKESERTLGLVQSLISMVESNTLSRGTTEMVMDLTYAVAEKMHYAEEHIRDLMYGTVLRDIGMIKTSNLILRSPRELMKEEWEVIKQHPVEGSDMLAKMNFSEHTRQIVLSHHERYNGEGYPSGLAGSQIPLGARILSVVESYAAMIQDRPTRPALTQEEALSTLRENWGLRYDPEVVKIFIDIIEEEIRGGERPRYRGIDLIAK
ncbi:MAG: HD domain-containing protein [Candidatus Latescibacterota bacterium]|nr:MAG: HD domain-containing protein [Candidatus Latescibacterota bacterium]